jgi:hypothetical protein
MRSKATTTVASYQFTVASATSRIFRQLRTGGWQLFPRALPCALVFALALSGAVAKAEIIDRMLAVVGGEIILLSDLTAAVRFGLIEHPPATPGDLSLRPALNALIDRELQLFEVNRYLPPEPSATAIDDRFAAIRTRLGEAAFQAALAEAGMSEVQLRARIRDNLRIDAYRAQRFGAALEPSEEDLLRYYRSNEAAFTKGDVVQPFAEVRADVRDRLVRERSTSLIAEWLDTLRRRTEIRILYPLGDSTSAQKF